MKTKIIFYSILFLLLHFNCIHAQERYPMNALMGMYGYGDTISIDETEILVEEWIDYMFYYDLESFPSYVKLTELSDKELCQLKKLDFNKNTIPVDNVVCDLIFSIFPKEQTNCVDFISYQSFGGTRGILPIDCRISDNKDSISIIRDLLKYPINRISYNQAVDFCNWRTKLDSLRYFNPKENNPFSPYRKFLNRQESFVFTLMTPEEYDVFIPNIDSIIDGSRYSSYNYKGASKPKKEKFKTINPKYGENNVRCSMYYNVSKKETKLMDIQGNVAEMTIIQGIAKGGSFVHAANQCNKGVVNLYNKPEKWLGFRCCAKRRK